MVNTPFIHFFFLQRLFLYEFPPGIYIYVQLSCSILEIRYNSRLCYGLIERDDTGHELFVHRNSIVMAPEELIFLKAQTPVLFDLWTLSDGRLEAQNVRAANGNPISLRDSKLLSRAACPHDDVHLTFRPNQHLFGECLEFISPLSLKSNN